ncbi:MAG: SpoIID/LytB domain-containing protein [Actinobacteria bacterium]|nr:SpoIID/LytB domain-containing protein [Actinomycetota bacterium]MBU4403359.1 SpoIID/LytB domain-containing protein [Actinomycetota bacterium]MBU4441289.1 SpoIID/LytB domain-containing protein [Actinomycetota bacterium]
MEQLKNAIKIWGALGLIVVLGIVAAFISLSNDSSARFKQAAREMEEADDEIDISNETPYTSYRKRSESFSGGSSEYTPDPESAPGSTVELDIAPLLNVSSLSAGTSVPGPDAVFVFTGQGRAHGVGLCMDGVKYRALAGHSCTDIIHYYYTGVQISNVDDNQPIRVKGRDGQVRTLPLKEYLYHLAEEPETYPYEGLKVLALAARTYTLSCIARGKHQGFDVCSSGNCCQAFSETKDLSKYPNQIRSIDETAGQIITYDGAPIIAAYCGSCGGHTDNYEDVWGGQPVPYLKGKPDSYCSQAPNFTTTVEISVADLTSKLNASVGTLELIDLSDRTPGGRVRTARVVGSSGTKDIKGKDLAALLGFRSTRIDYTFR